jgi:hypothetical protein
LQTLELDFQIGSLARADHRAGRASDVPIGYRLRWFEKQSTEIKKSKGGFAGKSASRSRWP